MKKDKLSRYDIEMLKALLSNKLTLLRVFPYESHIRDVIIGTNYSPIAANIKKGSFLYKRLVEIRKHAAEHGFDDNKIVIQVKVNVPYHTDSLFLGYWDDSYSIGTSVQPCYYTPKEFPKSVGNWVGMNVRFGI